MYAFYLSYQQFLETGHVCVTSVTLIGRATVMHEVCIPLTLGTLSICFIYVYRTSTGIAFKHTVDPDQRDPVGAL